MTRVYPGVRSCLGVLFGLVLGCSMDGAGDLGRGDPSGSTPDVLPSRAPSSFAAGVVTAPIDVAPEATPVAGAAALGSVFGPVIHSAEETLAGSGGPATPPGAASPATPAAGHAQPNETADATSGVAGAPISAELPSFDLASFLAALFGTDAPGSGSTTSAGAPRLPSTTGACPRFGNGTTVRIGRMNVVVYMDPAAKSKPAPGGPLVNYYHATLSSPTEVFSGFNGGLLLGNNIRRVTDMGGVVASYTSTACPGCATTDDFYWFVEDHAIQDQLVACAIEQANINPRQIHALGWSAGALHATTVGIQRSGYMASIISYSGGLSPWPLQNIPQSPSDRVAAIMTFGAIDWVVIDFPTQSRAYYSQFNPRGWYTMMCPTGGGHAIDGNVARHALKFFLDHPFQAESPYRNGIPAEYPSYCRNGT